MKRNIKSGLCSVLSAAMIIGMLPVQVNAAEYRDNTYRGTGKGLKGDITLDVTIKDGKITEIKVFVHISPICQKTLTAGFPSPSRSVFMLGQISIDWAICPLTGYFTLPVNNYINAVH